MLIVDHLPRALDALSAFTIHDSRLYLYHSTYHSAQIRNSPPSGNNTRRAATWECILSFILFFFLFPFLLFLSYISFLFFLFFFFLFPLRRNSNNLRSRRRAPSLTKSSEQPSLSRKIECRRTSTSIESHRFHVSYAPPFFLRQYHRRSHHDRLSKLNRHVQSREHSEHYYFKASIEFPTINNLRSTNQLTCCHANATRFEAGICISFVCSKFISSKST